MSTSRIHFANRIMRRLYEFRKLEPQDEEINAKKISSGFLIRILVAGERCNVTGEYFERGSV